MGGWAYFSLIFDICLSRCNPRQSGLIPTNGLCDTCAGSMTLVPGRSHALHHSSYRALHSAISKPTCRVHCKLSL
ncbi:hypothetical protein DFJ58DRAFT_800266, partial [Suillus subalutaceus]|uniref:uncharacterized protein n=1 Tax=Suillus subalutaceus TaxID=48586 RepID=UPI001B869CCB